MLMIKLSLFNMFKSWAVIYHNYLYHKLLSDCVNNVQRDEISMTHCFAYYKHFSSRRRWWHVLYFQVGLLCDHYLIPCQFLINLYMCSNHMHVLSDSRISVVFHVRSVQRIKIYKTKVSDTDLCGTLVHHPVHIWRLLCSSRYGCGAHWCHCTSQTSNHAYMTLLSYLD